MKNCKSFKVRINSASALATPQKREKFGSTQVYCDIWRNTIEAMSQSQQVDDFADYKYIASLSAQVGSRWLIINIYINTGGKLFT